jgi:predicted nucleic-acid-binding protein
MIAVDTNVVVRLLTADDPKQAAVVRSLFATQPIWIGKTVLLGNWLGPTQPVWI